MDKDEYEGWLKVTEQSADRWKVDQVTWLNGQGRLSYRGGADAGKYVWVSPDGKVQWGTYEGAFPHIGEALLHPAGSMQFDGYEAAMDALISASKHAGSPDVLGMTVTKLRLIVDYRNNEAERED